MSDDAAVSIVAFTHARLDEEAKACASIDDAALRARHGRMVDALRTVANSIEAQLDSHRESHFDSPLAAGLLVVAQVWAEHPDHQPRRWFPRMIAGWTPSQSR
ncbi:hypothetical protein [Gordonia malaquae]|uniref:hypothetical protein n=1 Tax=Gordonia malaquae TaxID=410332 RepID=UPI00301B69FD